MSYKDNGNRLRAMRGGRSQQTIASAIGISQSALAMYESGMRNPRDGIKIRLAKFFGVRVSDIFFAEETTNSSI